MKTLQDYVDNYLKDPNPRGYENSPAGAALIRAWHNIIRNEDFMYRTIICETGEGLCELSVYASESLHGPSERIRLQNIINANEIITDATFNLDERSE